MKKIFLLIFFISCKAVAIDHFVVSHEKVFLGYIVPSLHHPAKLPQNIYDKYNKMANNSKSFLVEADHTYLDTSIAIKEFTPQKSLINLIDVINTPCIYNTMKTKQVPDFIFNYGPAAFLVKVIHPITLTNAYQPKITDVSLDQIILNAAKKNSGFIFPLETSLEQVQIFKQNDDIFYVNEIEKSCSIIESNWNKLTPIQIDLDKLINFLISNKFNELREYYISSYRKVGRSSRVESIFFHQRDRLFTKRIVDNIFKLPKPVLISVGAAHIGGQGIVKQLRDAGFTVTQMKD